MAIAIAGARTSTVKRSIAEQSKDPMKSRPEIRRIWFFNDVAQIRRVSACLAFGSYEEPSEVISRILEYQKEEAPPYSVHADNVYTSHSNPSMSRRAKDDRHCKDCEAIMRDDRWRYQETGQKQNLRDEVRNALRSRNNCVYELQICRAERRSEIVPAVEREH
ncbi:hypothetical protein AC579_9733 [Pseudocercospora musae]|uniref:Uncharacterized protein n=1 Tax=Pseudocercospora musae TaxID=113226 RepID=A0A139I5H2_9PEZI|nr:hypothetical protein AC579_9733 [Pseudocercospora musae]